MARIGTSTRYFVESGVENGPECHTTALLLQGWRGLWTARNTIYHENGYCFRTARGKANFSNDGCVTSNQSSPRSVCAARPSPLRIAASRLSAEDPTISVTR